MNIHKYKRKLEILFRGAVNTVIFKLFFNKGFDPSKTLIVCGGMRSGSTWLAEIISNLPGYSQIFEPLNVKYIKETKESGFKVNMYLDASDEWDKGIPLFDKILKGKLINTWTTSQIKVSDVLKTKNIVVKMVRANMLLGWFLHHFKVRPPVLIIRHPCAIVSSVMSKKWIPNKKLLLSNDYFKKHPEMHEKCKHLSEPEELATLRWCLQYHTPLSLNKPYPFILVCYEQLVRDGAKELKRLFDLWGLGITDDIIASALKPSHTVTSNSAVATGKDPLMGWKKKLTQQQISNILDVVKLFSMDFYTEDVEPDYLRLYDFQAQISV